MPPRPRFPTYLDRSSLELSHALKFEQQREDSLAELRFGSALGTALDDLESTYQQSMQPPTELPIIVSDRPDAGLIRQAQAQQAQTLTPPQPAATAASGTPVAMPGGGTQQGQAGGGQGDLEAWARQEAARLGIDPEYAVRVANTEGGFADPVRQNMGGAPAYGPYQLYIGGSGSPGLGDEALQRGIDPRNPAHARAAITFALEHAQKNGWGAFQGAAANGIGDWDGIGGRQGQQPAVQGSVPRYPSAENAPERQGGDGAPLTPNQLEAGRAIGLSDADALAICGPVALTAYKRANGGQPPTLQEALQLAKAVGWNPDVGMSRGSTGFVEAGRQLGVNLVVKPVDWDEVANTVRGGQIVTLNSHGNGGHFWTVQGVRQGPNGLEFDFGNSAAVLKRSGGRRWLTPAEANQMGVGTISEAIYVAAP